MLIQLQNIVQKTTVFLQMCELYFFNVKFLRVVTTFDYYGWYGLVFSCFYLMSIIFFEIISFKSYLVAISGWKSFLYVCVVVGDSKLSYNKRS